MPRYRNIGGPHRRRDGTQIDHGEVFEAPEREADAFSDKFERVSSSAPMTGADIGLRALEWGSQAALDLALDEGVDADAFAETVEPSGATGYVTSDVKGFLEAGGD